MHSHHPSGLVRSTTLAIIASVAGACGSSSSSPPDTPTPIDAASIDAPDVDAAIPMTPVYFVDPAITGGDGTTWETALAAIPRGTPGRYYLRAGAVTVAATLADVELHGGQDASLTGTDVDPAPRARSELSTDTDALRLEGSVAVKDVRLSSGTLAVDGDVRLDRVQIDSRLVFQASATGTITGDDVTAASLSGNWGRADLTNVHGTFGGQRLEMMGEPVEWHCRESVCATSTTVGIQVDQPALSEHMVGTIVTATTPGAIACFRHGNLNYTSVILVATDPAGPWTVVRASGNRTRACHVIGSEPYVAFAFYATSGSTARWDLGASGVAVPNLGTTYGLFVASKASSGTVSPITFLNDRVVYATIDVLVSGSAP